MDLAIARPDVAAPVAQTIVRRSGFGNGSERRRTVSMTLKIALFAPIPRASVRMATKVKPGDLISWRMA